MISDADRDGSEIVIEGLMRHRLLTHWRLPMGLGRPGGRRIHHILRLPQRLVYFVITPSVHWSVLYCRASVAAGDVRKLSRRVTLGVLRGPDAEFGRTRALGAAAIEGDTAITAGDTIAAAEAT